MRVADFLGRIRTNPSLAQWFTKGRAAQTTRSPVSASSSGILPFLKTNNRDTDGSAIADLGFSLNLWNGSSMSLSITCGAFSPAIRNSVVLSLPATAELGAEDLANMRALLDAVIDVWAPDVAVATSSQLIAEMGGGMPWQTRGWLNYSRSKDVSTN